MRTQNHRFRQLFTVGQFITSEIHMDTLFEVIMDQTNKIMGTERSTVFLLDEKNDALWSLAATGMERNQIRIKANAGVAGWVLRNSGGFCPPEAASIRFQKSAAWVGS